MIQKIEKPISALDRAEGMIFKEKAGVASIKPMKKSMEGRKVKAGLMMVLASWRLQGAMVIQVKSHG